MKGQIASPTQCLISFALVAATLNLKSSRSHVASKLSKRKPMSLDLMLKLGKLVVFGLNYSQGVNDNSNESS